MANYFGISSDSVSTLFSSLGKNSGVNGSSSILATYAAIRNGSYHKLVKAYYSKTDDKAESTKTSTSTSKDTAKDLVSIKGAADDLKESAAVLLEKGKDSVFTKAKIKGDDGTEAYDYDVNAIYKAVSRFVKDYNSVVESTADASSTSILSPAAGMVKSTAGYRKALAEVGITVDSDNTLSIDEEAFKKADMENVKSLFQGAGSYAYTVQSKAFSVSIAVSNEQMKSSTYTSSGTYSYNYSSSFDNFF